MEPASGQVLVLNSNFEPLNITNLRRALSLLVLNKAEAVEEDGLVFHSERLAVRMPTVVRLTQFARRPLPKLKLTRRTVFARDNHSCQYCGGRSGGLTLDHILPRARGGTFEWRNLVCCCMKCNNKKGSRTPTEAGMHLVRQPRQPKCVPYISLPKLLAARKAGRWGQYLDPFFNFEELEW